MKFYMTPGSCTTGIHILLEELDLLFEVYRVDLLAGDHKKPEFLALNPKATIPLLVDDSGRAITEFPAIAYWLARRYPKAGLLSDNLDDEVRILETMDFVVSTLHMQGFARIFTTEVFTANPDEHEAVRQRGQDIVTAGFAVIAGQLGEASTVVGRFSIADAALFYTEFWADHLGIPMPEACARHYRAMLSRPAVRRVLMEEGYRVG
ncbi:glutathione S-transferase [Halothiobacillus diazotrophicus]|uniref:Glutathione S-transferase n=1 Tax=Halothiobacillus diazotrophicus TaxID=1860122 RepID=A0A191ZJN0_9GAMM|nr:glutathione S-transferase family protein [Halothiobacillus diazotrophicus]ANJ68043.1 glutathione S-transferase [Halothiobacillus diazotrophicus]